MRFRWLSPVLLFPFVALAQENAAPPAANKLPAATTVPVSADTRASVQKIVGDILLNGHAYEYDRQLSDEIGPRLTGSPAYLKAVAWGEAKFRELGLTNVHTENFTADTWEPEPGATGEITAPVQHTLHLWSYGWSPSTPKSGVSGEIIYLPSLSSTALQSLGKAAAGKILFFDRDSYPTPFTLGSYMEAVVSIESLHPAALIVAGRRGGEENLGALTVDGTLSSFPVAQVGMEDVLLFHRLLKASATVRVTFRFTNRTARHIAIPQVMADIRGSEKPDEIVIVGGHLDSWNPGTGAQDNGTGIAQVMDAARTIQALGHPPKRTIRFILFGGEEQALLGSAAYATAHAADMGKVDAVIITDLGGGAAKGWHMMGRTDERKSMADITPLLSGLGSDGMSEDTRFMFGSDQAPFLVQGVPTMLMWTDMTTYDTIHHRASDTFDSVNKANLLQGDATVAVTAYAVADAAMPLAAHITAPQVEIMLKEAKQWDDYQAMRSSHLLP